VVSGKTATDVFIIGGGPAGLAAAIAARQRGLSVTVADGTEPPIDKACGEGLMPETLAALGQLGVKIPPNAGAVFRGIRLVQNNDEVTAEFPDREGLGIRRTTLHECMIERAKECAVRLLWRTPVVGINAVGVELSHSVTPARWIVGADGSGSRVRSWAGLDSATRHAQRYATRRHYRLAPWTEHVEIYWSKLSQAYVTPVGRKEICVVVMGETVEGADFDCFLTDCPKLQGRLAGAEVCSRERGAVTLMHSLSAVHSRNIALIGDASGGVDAITGEGLRLAFRQAISLAASLEKADLSSYGRAHRELTRKPLLMGDLLLTLGRNDRLRMRVIGMLAERPKLFARMLALHSGHMRIGPLRASAQLGWEFLTA
jgi:flavin-dependent dehydrogenase